MATNETLANLATLLSALQEYNRPERETQMYAKKAMIDMVTQANLAKYQYDLAKEESEEARQLQLFRGESLVESALETGNEAEEFRKISTKLDKSSELLEEVILSDKEVYGTAGMAGGFATTKSQVEKVRGENVLDNLYSLNSELPSIVEGTANPAAKTIPELLAPFQDTFDMIEESRTLLERSFENYLKKTKLDIMNYLKVILILLECIVNWRVN